jgi:hypothetical protein
MIRCLVILVEMIWTGLTPSTGLRDPGWSSIDESKTSYPGQSMIAYLGNATCSHLYLQRELPKVFEI